MSSGGRPLKIPGHRPLSRPEDRERPFSGTRRNQDQRLGPLARCLSRSRRSGTAIPPVRAVTDAVAGREAALRRLFRVAEAHAEDRQTFSEVRRELVDALLHVRVLSLEVVEAIERWRSSNSRGGGPWIDPATGENYLLKMKDDTRWLADNPLGEILFFSPKSDPFFVVPSTRECATASTNQMTPTLQARRVAGQGERRAVLPLQSSLLRRIRKAELLILRESVQARMLQGPSAGGDPSNLPRPSAPVSATASQGDYSKVQANLLSASLGVLEEVALTPSSQFGSAEARQLKKSLDEPLFSAPPRARAARPEDPVGAFKLRPVGETVGSIRGVFQQYAARVESRLVNTLEPWKALEGALEDTGSCCLEWFWLFKADQPAGAVPDGLAIFRLKRMSTVFGQLLHVSTANIADLQGAVSSIKAWMFSFLPIKSVRTTLWYVDSGNGLELDKQIQDEFKKCRFKWFQLTNQNGVRGQVMEARRWPAEACDDPDPLQPPEIHGIEIALGQAWLRGGKTGMNPAIRFGSPCGGSLLLAATCMRFLWAKDSGDANAKADIANAVAREAAKDGLVRGILSGEFEKLLSKCAPVELLGPNDGIKMDDAGNPALALTTSLARNLEANQVAVPAVMCDLSDKAGDLIKRGSAHEAFADAASGLKLEDLPASVEAMGVQEVAFGRLFITLDFQSVRMLASGDAFEVPVDVAGLCPSHPHPVFYAATSESESFLVIIPFAGLGSVPPSNEACFVACTEILRDTKPMDSPPFKALRLSSFDVRHAARTFEVSDSTGYGIPAASGPLHIAEFDSVSVTPGRQIAGRLRQTDERGAAVFAVERPFAVCLWHTDVDELNVPLVATMVV